MATVMTFLRPDTCFKGGLPEYTGRMAIQRRVRRDETSGAEDVGAVEGGDVSEEGRFQFHTRK